MAFILKRVRTLALIVLCSPGAYAFQNATVLAAEPFNSAAGPLNATNGGEGWGGAWQVQNGSTAVPGYDIATSSPLAYSGVSQSGGYSTGGTAYLYAGRFFDTSSGGAFAAYLNNGLIGNAGQTLYASVLMRKDIDTDDEMSVTFHAGNPPWWVNVPGIAIGHFGSGSDTNGVRYWSLRMDGVIYQTTTPVVVGQAAFLVLRITFGAVSTVSLFVDPPAGSLPATPGAQATTTNSIAFCSFAFYGGSGVNQSSIDEIRVASSYAPLFTGLEPPPAAPTSLVATPGNKQVALSWSAVPGASGYRVYQATTGAAVLRATVTTNSYVATGLTNATVYTFYVTAIGSNGVSAASAQVQAAPRGPAPAPHPYLGTNLSAVADYARAWPFVDAFKTARPWISQEQGASWGSGPSLQLDSNGWIASLQPGQYAETIMYDNAITDTADYPTGQYTLLYDGSGTLSFDMQSATIVSQTPGRMVVNVPAGQNGIYLIESATDISNPIRNIRFILPGFESTYQTQPFHPLFLQRLGIYGVLRFMEWTLVNNSTLQNWSDRAQTTDYTYCWRGVPLEVMIELANTLKVKPWFNMPAQATDDFIRQFATTIAQKLSTQLNFFLEYSNETWNGEFTQFTYTQSQGIALGLSSDPTLSSAYYTAYRAVQMFKIFQSVFGNASRMTRVIASEAANSWLSNQTLGFQNAFVNADALAIAPYFNCSDIPTGGFGILGDAATATQVDAMSIAQVESIELQHIQNCTQQEIQSNIAVAQSYGLKTIAYEGGQSLVGINGAQSDQSLATLFKAVNRDPGMGPLYQQYLNNWVASGGDLFVHYSDIGASSQYGSFGTLEYQDENPSSSPKYSALTSFSGQHH
jgi:hypothetical protein